MAFLVMILITLHIFQQIQYILTIVDQSYDYYN